MKYAIVFVLVALAMLFGCTNQQHGTNATGNDTGSILQGSENVIIPDVPAELNESKKNQTQTNQQSSQQNQTQSKQQTSQTAANKPADQPTNETIEKVLEKDTGKNRTSFLFGNGKYMLVLDDVVISEGVSCAAISIKYADGRFIKKDLMCPNSDYTWTDPNRETYRIRIFSAGAGYQGGAWADAGTYVEWNR
jgi:Skp family chaperone for outer membrane proteins